MALRINPFNSGNPMTFQDAATVAFITALAIWILEFLASAQWEIIVADPGAFVFNCVKTFATSWAGSFISLAGLEEYVKRKEKKNVS